MAYAFISTSGSGSSSPLLPQHTALCLAIAAQISLRTVSTELLHEAIHVFRTLSAVEDILPAVYLAELARSAIRRASKRPLLGKQLRPHAAACLHVTELQGHAGRHTANPQHE